MATHLPQSPAPTASRPPQPPETPADRAAPAKKPDAAADRHRIRDWAAI